MGYDNRIFSALQCRQLDKDELRELFVLLFGKKPMLVAPDIRTEWKRFSTYVSSLNQREGKHWNVHTRRIDRWIDVRKLDKIYGEGVGPRRRLSSIFSGWSKKSGPSSLLSRQPHYAVVDI